MNDPARKSKPATPNRRQFVQGSTAAVVAGGLLTQNATARMAHSGVDETLKVGLIGCGGRGTGAAVNAVRADKNAKLTVMCDLFADRLDHSRMVLKNQIADQYDVADDACFTDFDGYQKGDGQRRRCRSALHDAPFSTGSAASRHRCR